MTVIHIFHRLTPPCCVKQGKLWAVEGNVVLHTMQTEELRDWRQREMCIFSLSLTMIAPFELSTFTGSQWFLLICATLSVRQLGFGEKAKFYSCLCDLCFSRSSCFHAIWHDVGSIQSHPGVTYTRAYLNFVLLSFFLLLTIYMAKPS